MENIFNILKKEHSYVKKGLGDIMKDKKDNFDEIIIDLDKHLKGEEKEVYPVLANYADLKFFVIESLEEHKHARMLLDELSMMDPKNEEFKPKLKVLIEMLKHHIKEEEANVFPIAKKNLDKSVTDELSINYLALKEEE